MKNEERRMKNEERRMKSDGISAVRRVWGACLGNHVGCSNFAAWQLCEALWTSDRRDLAPFVSVQPRYNLLDRTVESDLLPPRPRGASAAAAWRLSAQEAAQAEALTRASTEATVEPAARASRDFGLATMDLV